MAEKDVARRSARERYRIDIPVSGTHAVRLIASVWRMVEE